MPRKKPSSALIPLDRVQQSIIILRGERVILAADLARLYGVPVKRLNEAIKRNAGRFPEDFMFQLIWDETGILRSQFATLSSPPPDTPQKSPHGKHTKYLPYAFTEHGAIMAATVLNSPEAVKASLYVVRAFVQLRRLLSTHHELAAKLAELEHKLEGHDDQIQALIDAIRQLMDEPEDPPKPPIGFLTEAISPHPSAARKPRKSLSAK